MSTTITLSMSTLLVGVPTLVAFSGAVTFVALRGYLVDAVEGHRLLAANDRSSARWLFLRGYRKTPNAGPDVTPEPEPLAISATAFDPDADEVGDEQPGATLMRPVLAVARWVGYGLALVDTAVDFVRTKVDDALRSWRERDQVGTGETPHLVYDEAELTALGATERELAWLRVGEVPIFGRDTDAENNALYEAVGSSDGVRPWLWSWSSPPVVADDPEADRWAEDAAIVDGPDTAEPVQIVHVNRRYRRPGDTGMFPLVKVVGDKAAGRHRAAPEPEMPAINPVPAQRTGDHA